MPGTFRARSRRTGKSEALEANSSVGRRTGRLRPPPPRQGSAGADHRRPEGTLGGGVARGRSTGTARAAKCGARTGSRPGSRGGGTTKPMGGPRAARRGGATPIAVLSLGAATAGRAGAGADRGARPSGSVPLPGAFEARRDRRAAARYRARAAARRGRRHRLWLRPRQCPRLRAPGPPPACSPETRPHFGQRIFMPLSGMRLRVQLIRRFAGDALDFDHGAPSRKERREWKRVTEGRAAGHGWRAIRITRLPATATREDRRDGGRGRGAVDVRRRQRLQM